MLPVVTITTFAIMARARAGKPGRKGGNVPMSLRFPPALRDRVRRFAAQKGLEEATAVRMLCTERLDELAMHEELKLAEKWQLEQALHSWQLLQKGALALAPDDALSKVFSAARARRSGSR